MLDKFFLRGGGRGGGESSVQPCSHDLSLYVTKSYCSVVPLTSIGHGAVRVSPLVVMQCLV